MMKEHMTSYSRLGALSLLLVTGMIVLSQPAASFVRGDKLSNTLTTIPPLTNSLASVVQIEPGKQESIAIGLRLSIDRPDTFEEIISAENKGAVHTAQKIFLQYMDGYNIQVQDLSRYSPYITLVADQAALRRIRLYKDMTSIAKNFGNSIMLDESVPQINVPTVWDQGYKGSGQRIAIADTGVESSHPFLAGKVMLEACFSTNANWDTDAALEVTSLCENGDTDVVEKAGAAEPCSTAAECYHGTHVAGIAAGKNGSYDGRILNGVAPEAQIIALQVFSQVNDSSGCDGEVPCLSAYNLDIDKGLRQILIWIEEGKLTRESVAAVNLSLGNRKVHYNSEEECNAVYPNLTTTVQQLYDSGIPVVAISGNESSTNGINFPSCISHVISVGNVTKSDTINSTSNSGILLDVLAPGTNILSSTLGGTYQEATGTSMAAPHVSGTLAVMRSSIPTWTIDGMENDLEKTGKLITDTRNGIVKPRINVAAALDGPCLLYSSGDVVIDNDCAVGQNLQFSGNITVTNGATMHIVNGALLDLDFTNHFLKIKQGSGVQIQDGSTID